MKYFYFITVYTPNSQSELARLDYRMKWEEDFLTYLKKLEETKPVIFCGDLNVAHTEIDLKNPKTNRKMPDLPMRNGKNSQKYWNPVSSIPSVIFIRIRRASIPGGLTGLKREKRMRDGGSTISVCPKA